MSDKTIVLITGANSGIGKATAAALLQSSSKYHVIATSRNAARGAEAVKELEALNAPGSISYIQLDATDEASIDAAAAQVTSQHGRLDVLINNAGVNNHSKPLADYTRECLATNCFGPVMVAAAFKPLLKHSSDPRSIYISSLMGHIPWRLDTTAQQPPRMVAYRMSKAALNMVVACEVRDDGDWLKSWAVCPGLVVTNLGGGPEVIRNMGGTAVDVPGQTILGIVEGKRDGEVGQFVHKDGVYSWGA